MRRGGASVGFLAALGLVVLAATGTPASALYVEHDTWGGLGTEAAQLNFASDVALDAGGSAYVVDGFNNRVQKFSPSGAFLRSWGSVGTGNSQFNFPVAVAVDRNGNVFVADFGNDRIQRFTAEGTFVSAWGVSGAAPGEIDRPSGVALDDMGHIYVSDIQSDRISKFTYSGTFVDDWGSPGTAAGEFDDPTGIAVDAQGHVYVTDTDNDRIQKFTSAGVFVAQWGQLGAGPGQFDHPIDVTVAPDGALYVADQFNDRIQKLTKGGAFVASWDVDDVDGSPGDPVGVAVQEDGDVVVANGEEDRVVRFRPVSPKTTVVGPSRLIRDSTPTFTFASSINPATFQCRIRGSGLAFKTCTTPYTTPVLDDGLNILVVRAVDAHKLVDPTPFEAEFRVDATRPLTFLDAGPALRTKDRTPTFAFSSNERATFQCSIDGGAFTACASPRTTAQLSFATHTFRVRARDRAGNLDATPATRTFTVVR